jgi:hypothetical protein
MQRLTHIGVFSLGKVMGVCGLFIGLLVGIGYGLIFMLIGAAGGASGEDGAASFAVLGIGGGLFAMAVVPLIYGVVSFIAGVIYGLIINVALYLSGGIELRIEPPRQFSAVK